ncbi:DUF6493 family protein [Kribbella albertanoniae]|uniref:HEAT repeat domain-containing protein n=1 Tax=Kribbella albertanoniae TaxID=1266829 RepID=A0A4R4QEH3_9ACTN|nr:DUF6493 family protein [Kribbella albertanoniae]TDC33543.1 hypothetical protein E1261_05915 [Kribbella albertanoniae]
MGELPSYTSLVGVAPATLFGLLESGADKALNASYEFAWQKDHALLGVIDRALAAAATGSRAADASRPRWLQGLVTRELSAASTSSWSSERFLRVRLLERLGLVQLDVDESYVLAMVSAVGPDKSDKLRADPDLVERALWRVFEVEGGGEVSLTNVDRFGADDWRKTFLELTSDRTLDRTRVITACLHALGRDFAAYRASWYSATYLALEPTAEETAGLQTDLRRLLSSAVPATVAFAVKQLARVQKTGLLDVEATLEALPPATVVKAKGTAIAALTLARAGRADFRGLVGIVARAALGHPHPDVQRAAAKLLADLGEADGVLAAAEDLTPSVRQELGLQAEARQENEVPHDQSLAPVPVPVSTRDLAERAAALLEDASDAGELEAVLACLATGGAEVLEPLRKRAKAVVARGPQTDLGDSWLPGQVARLVLSVLGDTAPPAVPDHPAQRFVARRLSEIYTSGAPLLATPDLPGGWVDPMAFVERLVQNPSPRHHDLIAALLRLHPDGRDDAARTACSLPAAARFALDGVEPTRRLLRSGREGPAAWWIAAERSWTPYTTAAPQLSGDVKTHTWQENGRDRRSWYAKFTVTTANTDRPTGDQPTELKTQTSDRWGDGSASRFLGDWIPTLAAIWPRDAEHFLSLTCLPVLESPNWAESTHDVPRTLDALARHPGRMGTLAAATLAAGISATQRDHRLHAVDAFIDLVVSGRIPVHEVASVMARYAGVWPANRWVESLASVAQVPGGAAVTVDLLTCLLPQLSAEHRGLKKLLDLLRDELIRLDRRATDPALAQWLGGFAGSSAAARTARLLLG